MSSTVLSPEAIVTNRVFSATIFPKPSYQELHNIEHKHYREPTRGFCAGILRNCPGTILLFATGKAVINKCKTVDDAERSIYKCAMRTNLLLSDLKLVNVVGTMKFNCKFKTDTLVKTIPGAIFEPELHCGLLFYVNSVSVIVYHTGTVMFAGSKSDEEFEHVANVIRETLMPYGQ